MRAIYRVQLTPAFGFAALRASVAYLHRLGISHLYLSPIFRSRAGSTHGYDITDHAQINPELGGDAGFHALVTECHAHSMGVVLDIVPNHMAVMTAENAWWFDLLEHGPASRFAEWFDIDWAPARASMRNRLLVPALGSPLGEVIAQRGLKLQFDPSGGMFSIRYEALEFPLDPATYPRIVQAISSLVEAPQSSEQCAHAQLAQVLSGFTALPPAAPCSHEMQRVRGSDALALQRQLALLCEQQPEVVDFINAGLHALHDVPQELSAELLAGIQAAQPYRLAFWRVSGEEINYRRFFDVNDLAALRMERREVFDVTHALPRRLWQSGCIDGVRVDHADGLYRPAQYFHWLRELLGTDPAGRAPWIVAEKILGKGEVLPADWQIDGTTGYDFAAQVTAWLMNDRGAAELEKIHRKVTGGGPAYAEVAYQSRRHVMRTSLAAEISGLATRLDRLAQLHLDTSDFTLFDLREAIVDVIACFPVYRTYIGDGPVSAGDARYIRRAVGMGISRKQTLRRALEFLERVLLGELATEPVRRAAALDFTHRFQQVTGPVMAKGIEDTACYRYPSLLAMNEVGGDPVCRGLSTEALHQANARRGRDHPRAVLASSTHDTKRGEDARYRLCALTELHAAWGTCLRRWRRLKGQRHGVRSVGATQEYLLLQSLLAIWPLPPSDEDTQPLRARMEEYAVKSAREAKERTSWLDHDAEYEAALHEYLQLLLPARRNSGFPRYFRAVIDQAAYFGMLNALSACVLKFTAPGVPDIYQGNELPAFVLVDPDNRRQPDFHAHSQLLGEVVRAAETVPPAAAAAAMLDNWWDGKLKLFLSWRLLNLRKDDPELFNSGTYTPLAAEGTHAEHLCAFIREGTRSVLIVVVSRWAATLSRGSLRAPLGGALWQDTRIPLPTGIRCDEYTDVLSGRTIHVNSSAAPAHELFAGSLFEILPVAVLLGTLQSHSSNSSSERAVTP
jgi:(1->4)-alpha-D-glucan 1-alpha-D-glucosylmutase